MMNSSDQLYVNHEVRIQLMEEVVKDIKVEMKSMRQDSHSQFRWTITIILGSVLLPVVLHWAKLL